MEFISKDFESVFSVKLSPEGFLLYIIETYEAFEIDFSLKVSSDKSVSFFSKGRALDRKLFKCHFSKPYMISSIDHFKKIIKFFSQNYQNFISDPLSEKYDLEQCINYLKRNYDCYLKSRSAYLDLRKFVSPDC